MIDYNSDMTIEQQEDVDGQLDGLSIKSRTTFLPSARFDRRENLIMLPHRP